jgi:hypothetical protein
MVKTLQVIVLLILVPACAGQLPAYQPVSVPDEGIAASGFEHDAYVSALQAAGASNIVVARGMLAERVTTAVMADHLDRVALFLDGVHLDDVEIPGDARSAAFHASLKLVTAGDSAGLVLVAEGLEVDGRRAGLLTLFDQEGVRETTVLPLTGLVVKNGGMRDPYIGGTDLESGILLSARTEEGKPWQVVYVVSLVDRAIGLDKLTPAQACACSSYLSWKQGQDGRTLFGMVVE